MDGLLTCTSYHLTTISNGSELSNLDNWGYQMTKLPSRKQIAMAIVKVSKIRGIPQSFDAVLAELKKRTLNECRWILHTYPSVRAAMPD